MLGRGAADFGDKVAGGEALHKRGERDSAAVAFYDGCLGQIADLVIAAFYIDVGLQSSDDRFCGWFLENNSEVDAGESGYKLRAFTSGYNRSLRAFESACRGIAVQCHNKQVAKA